MLAYSLLLALVLLGLVSACCAQAVPAGAGAPCNLRCEYLIDPRGIDVARPRLSWEVADERRSAAQTAYHVLVAGEPGRLARDEGDRWDSGRVTSDQSAHVVYAGHPLLPRQTAWWKVRTWDAAGAPSPWSAPATWSLGLRDAEDWEAQWIADPAEPPPFKPADSGDPSRQADRGDRNPPAPAHGDDPLPPPRLRKAFTLEGGAAVRRATCYVTALGLYELRLNGQRVGDHVLAPEWTDYQRRVQYQTYDVTGLVRAGENALGVQLGDGWCCGRIGLSGIVPDGPRRRIYADRPRLLLRLEIELADGRTHVVKSDDSWRSTTEGPIRVSDLLDGEVYDAQREQPGWHAPGYDDSAWSPVVVPATLTAEGGPAAVVAQPNEPIRVTRTLPAVGLTQPQPGVWVYDLGQNMVGWCRINLRAPAGTTVTLRHAEVLNPDGTLYVANLRTAAQKDQYICRRPADGETFEPHFTYHGFRYVEVTGLPAAPQLGDLVGCVFHSAAPECGEFACSDARLNRLWQNIDWTLRANLMSVPTDCPQRDERLGWMGDILAFSQTACFDLDMSAFFTKWLADVRDAQTADGRYPDFAPHPFDPTARCSSAPGWGDAGVFVPWCAYVNYADRRLLEQHFDSARRWVDYVRGQNPDLLWKRSRGNDYGDWLNADTLKLEGWPAKGAEVPKELFATAFFARSTQLVAEMARVLGRDEEARRYAERAGEIRAAFNRAYVQPDGTLTGDTQAGYALALAFDLLDPPQQEAALGRMVAGFERYHGSISTGFHSTICMMNELTRRGRTDEAYRLLLNRTMPSWLYAVEHGATTIWERWDGYVEGRGFQDPNMNSFAHYAYGSVGEWMFRTIIGLNPDAAEPGYKHFTLRPRPGGGLTWARGAYRSLHGRIACAWRVDAGRLTIDVTIPANTTATVYVPAADAEQVQESGRPASTADGVRFLRADDGAAVYAVAAGRYTFTAPRPD